MGHGEIEASALAGESVVLSGEPRLTARGDAKVRACAALRQGVWEASQFLSADEVREYVEGVLREIVSDEP